MNGRNQPPARDETVEVEDFGKIFSSFKKKIIEYTSNNKETPEGRDM
jgi:hypothetical protein